jgi:phenylalanyl-tRNA synthetase beta subunit
VRLVLGSDAETLTDERIDGIVKSVTERLQSDLGARLRG